MRARRRILRYRTSAGALLIGSLAVAQAAMTSCSPHHKRENLFSTSDRSQTMDFWSASGRLSIGAPASAETKGAWQVRLTPEGSTWLWTLNKGHKSAASLLSSSLPAAPAATGGGSTTGNDEAPKTSAPLPTSLLEKGSAPLHPARRPCPPAVQAVHVAPVVQPQTGAAETWDQWIAKRIRYDRWQALQEARSANTTGPGPNLPPADRDTPETEPEKPGPCPNELQSSVGAPPPFAAAVQPKSYTVRFDDATLAYEDNVKMGARYAYYRFSDGVMSGGVPLKRFDPDHLDKIFNLAGCDSTQAHVMKAVSPLEGGFDSINTYDTGYVSVGFIQFASLREGGGSLGAVLLAYKNADPTGFDKDFHRFGVDVQASGILDVLDPATGQELSGPEANAKIIKDKRLIAVFQRAGQVSDGFCAAQVRTALNQYYPAQDTVQVNTGDGVRFTCKVADLVHSESGLAMLFDRKVNTGNINILSRQASAVACNHHCESPADLDKYEKELIAGIRYRADFTQDPTLTQPTGSRR